MDLEGIREYEITSSSSTSNPDTQREALTQRQIDAYHNSMRVPSRNQFTEPIALVFTNQFGEEHTFTLYPYPNSTGCESEKTGFHNSVHVKYLNTYFPKTNPTGYIFTIDAQRFIAKEFVRLKFHQNTAFHMPVTDYEDYINAGILTESGRKLFDSVKRKSIIKASASRSGRLKHLISDASQSSIETKDIEIERLSSENEQLRTENARLNEYCSKLPSLMEYEFLKRRIAELIEENIVLKHTDLIVKRKTLSHVQSKASEYRQDDDHDT